MILYGHSINSSVNVREQEDIMTETYKSDLIQYSVKSCSNTPKMHCDFVIDSDGIMSVTYCDIAIGISDDTINNLYKVLYFINTI